MAPSRLVWPVSVVVALAGCASVNEEPPEIVSVPVAWKAAALADGLPDEPRPEAWWRDYHDETLNRIVALAHAANLDVRLAVTRVAQGWASVDAARAERRPLIALNTNLQRQRTPATGLQAGTEPAVLVPPSTRNQLSVELQTSFELDVVNRLGKALGSAQAQLKADEFDAQAVRLAVTNSVVQAWLDVRLAENRHQLGLRLIAAASAVAEGESKRVTAGFGTSQTKRDAAQTVVEAKQKQAEALRDREQGLARLALLVGESPMESSVRWIGLAIGPLPELKIAPDLPAEVVARRPDVQALWQRLSSAVTDVERAKLERYPAVSLTSTLGFVAERLTDWLKRDAATWAFGALGSLPVFDGGRNTARVEQSRASRAEREVLYRQSVFVALQEVESGLIQWQAAQAQLRLIQDVQALRLREMVDVQRSIQAGTLNRLAYLRAELRILEASTSLVGAQRDVAVAYAVLQTSLGRP